MEKFLEKIKELNVSIYEKNEKKQNWYSRDQYSVITKRSKKSPSRESFLFEEWVSGGVSGGSCWDDGSNDRHYATSGDKEPDFSSLDTILENLCPNISFIKYKKLVNEIVKYGDYSVNEYYGNSTNYGYKTINLGDLYDKLKEMSLI